MLRASLMAQTISLGSEPHREEVPRDLRPDAVLVLRGWPELYEELTTERLRLAEVKGLPGTLDGWGVDDLPVNEVEG